MRQWIGLNLFTRQWSTLMPVRTVLATLFATALYLYAVSVVSADGVQTSPTSVAISVDPATVVGHISPHFIGLGYESAAVAQPNFFTASNLTMIRLYRNLSTDGLIRIGGNVSDHTLYEPDSAAIPEAESRVTIINRESLTRLGEFAKATGWHIMWGLNAETDSVDDGIIEAQAVNAALGMQLQSFEVGNEVQAHRQFHGKFDDYYAYYSTYKSELRKAMPGAPLSGPDSIGGDDWVGEFAAREGNDVKLLTDHYYRAGAPEPAATLDNLLNTDTEYVNKLARLEAISDKSGVPYRFNEMNSFWGGGKAGVSDTFGSALWVLDTMFLMAEHGCDGINLETDVNQLGWISHYSPIVHDPATGACSVRPDYYGMLAFSIAGKGELVKTSVTKDDINITAYSAEPDHNTLWVIVINKDQNRDAAVSIPTPSGYTANSIYRLTAPSDYSTADVTLADAAVDAAGGWKPGKAEKVTTVNSAAALNLPRTSAALVKFTK